MALLAAFQVFLHRYTEQHDIVVGSPTAGRTRSEFEGLVGYFVNPVVLRGDLSGDPTFLTCIDRARAVVVAALKNADYPLPLAGETPSAGTRSQPLAPVPGGVQPGQDRPGRLRQAGGSGRPLSRFTMGSAWR